MVKSEDYARKGGWVILTKTCYTIGLEMNERKYNCMSRTVTFFSKEGKE